MNKSIIGFVGAAFALMLMASSAQAAFVLSTIKTSSGGFDIYQIQVLNDGLATANSPAGTGTRLAVADVKIRTLDSAGVPIPDLAPGTALRVISQDLDGDGEPDVNFNGSGIAYGSNLGTFMRIGNGTAIQSASGLAFINPGAYHTDNDGDSETPGDPLDPRFANLHFFNVVTSRNDGGLVANVTAAKIANVVVPTNGFFDIFAEVGGDSGNIEIVSFTNVPEPASMGLLSLAAFGLLGARRRD